MRRVLRRLILGVLITPRQQQAFQIVRNVTTSKTSVRNLENFHLFLVVSLAVILHILLQADKQ